MKKTVKQLRERIEAICRELKLPAMASAYMQQCKTPVSDSMPFDERLAALLEQEKLSRWHKRQLRNLKNARMPQAQMARLENIDWKSSRGLNKGQIEALCDCSWLEAERKPWVVIHGVTGVGKSFLAKTLTYEACMKGYSALYFRQTELQAEIESARSGGRIISYRKSLMSKQLLVIDDFGIEKMDDWMVNELLTIIEQRIGERSLIIVSQIPLEKWHKYFGDPVKADAIMDRVINQSYSIEIKGASMREKYGAMALQKEEDKDE